MVHFTVALAVLAACVCLTAAQGTTIIIPWVEREATGYAPRNVSCTDVVLFKWGSENHNVKMTDGTGCTTPTLFKYYEGPNGAVPFYFSYPGAYYYACKVNDHCTKGKQFITINVGQCAAPGELAWSFRSDNSTYAPITVPCGTSVKFAWASGRHNVVQVASDSCTAGVVKSLGAAVAGPASATVKFTKPGMHYFISAVSTPVSDCKVGNMKVAINVLPSKACAVPPAKASSPPPRARPPPKRMPFKFPPFAGRRQ